jgi:endonuclease/exonuclease/phosphatase family metal-dependent hydrolase
MIRHDLLLTCLGWLAFGVPIAAGCAAPPAPVRVRVLTYNIHHGEGNDGVLDLERLARVIREANPDLVALQEVDEGTVRAGGVLQVQELGKMTGMEARFGEAMPFDGGSYGEGILTRFPLVSAVNHALPVSEGHEPRAALVVHVRPPGTDRGFLFIGTHLDHTQETSERVAQARRIRDRLAAHDALPSILAGDLNAEPGRTPMAVLEQEWTRIPTGPSYPSVDPEFEIDHVLVRPANRWRVIETRVIDEPDVSDHLPVLVVLEWLPKSLE